MQALMTNNQQLLRYRYYSSPLTLTAILYNNDLINSPQNIIIKSPHHLPSTSSALKISSPPSRHHNCILNRRASSSSSIHNNSNNTTAIVLSQEGENQGNSGGSSSSTGGSGGGGGDGNHTNGHHSSNSDDDGNGNNHSGNATVSGIIIGLFVNGWRSRVSADPDFPFKLLMEQVVGLTSCVLGDMASRPNFGLNELDFVFSTLVVGAILNFVLMYLLAPTTSSSTATATATLLSSASPNICSIFSGCPKGHMFESGSYSILNRFGTLVYKGIFFSAVGFAAGLVGTAISTGLMKVRKKMDPHFETPNKPPPTVLNALTWAAHMGLSCNLRYQTLTGVEFLLGKSLPPWGFKTSVIVLRCLNNVFGGVSFVMMARLTGSQKNQLQKLEQDRGDQGGDQAKVD